MFRIQSMVVFVLLALVNGCSPCETLEEKLCEDLGERECAVWREHGSSGMPTGRRQVRACVNSLYGPTYSATLKGARAVVESIDER